MSKRKQKKKWKQKKIEDLVERNIHSYEMAVRSGSGQGPHKPRNQKGTKKQQEQRAIQEDQDADD